METSPRGRGRSLGSRWPLVPLLQGYSTKLCLLMVSCRQVKSGNVLPWEHQEVCWTKQAKWQDEPEFLSLNGISPFLWVNLQCSKDTSRNYCSKQFFVLSLVFNHTVETEINWSFWEQGSSVFFLGGRKWLAWPSPWTLAKRSPVFIKWSLLNTISKYPAE